MNPTKYTNQVQKKMCDWGILTFLLDEKIELKEYDHIISYLKKGEDTEKGIKNADETYSLVGVKLGKHRKDHQYYAYIAK